MEYIWKIVKMHKQRKHNTDPLKQPEGKPTYLANLGQTPTWLCSRPIKQPTWQRRCRGGPAMVRPHRHWRLSGHLQQGGAFNAPKVGCSEAFIKYLSKPSLVSYKRRRPPSHISSMKEDTTQERAQCSKKRRRATLIS